MNKTIRHQAVDILNEIAQSHFFASDLLDAAMEQQALSGTANGRLLTHLVYGVLRAQSHLDWILAGFYRGDYTKMEEKVKNILRTGLYQLKFSDRLPSFAVVDEAVKITKRINPGAAGLVNAVLRGYLRDPDKIAFPSIKKYPAEHIATLQSHPSWLTKIWLSIFGFEETMALCQANNELPPSTIRVNTLKISRPELEIKLQNDAFSCTPTEFSPDGINIITSTLPVQKTIFFKEGLLRIQDEAAQLVSCLVDPAGGDNVLDVCAGSGGKTTHLAARMKNEGRIIALELNAEKIFQLKKERSRMGATIIEPISADLTHPLSSEFIDKFDHVLVDAPCSGTGTLRRNPEIKWRITASDIDASAKKQMTILQNAAKAVKKGGRLIYCTCSLLPAENDQIIRQFIAINPQFTVCQPSSVIDQSLTDSRGFFRTYPHRQNMDGFFGAVLRRRM